MAEVSLDNAPRKAKELFDKGLSAFERGNLDYAMNSFMAALDIEPRLLQARKFLRAAAVKQFKDSKGGQMTHLISGMTGSLSVMMATGQIKKKPIEAIQAAEKLLRKDPFNKGFINLLTKAAAAAEMPEVAIQTLEVARDHYPEDVELLKDLGKLYTDVNKTHEARLCFEEVARLKPNDPSAIKALKDASAIDTMHKGGWTQATSYRDVIKDTKEATLLEQQSKAMKSDSDLDALINEVRGKIQREPDNINYVRSLADLLTRAERFDEALELLRETQEGLGRGDPQVERTISALHVSKFAHEIKKLEQAGDAAGVEAKKRERDEFLLADAADRVKRYPNDLQFRYEYGTLLFDRGLLNEAIQEFQLAQRNPQRRIRALYYMALCFKQKSQFDIAMEQLQKAASELHIMDDTKKDVLYEMGAISELMGQAQQAAQFYKEIYSVDIRYKDVAQKIEKAYMK